MKKYEKPGCAGCALKRPRARVKLLIGDVVDVPLCKGCMEEREELLSLMPTWLKERANAQD